MLYSFLLPIHSVWRWAVVLAALAATGYAFYGWLTRKEWTRLADRLGLVFTIVLDIQVLIGLILYFFASPITTAALRNLSGALQNPQTSFFLVEHSIFMLVGLAIAHIGRSVSRKAGGGPARYRAAAVLFGLSILVILTAIPWGFRPLI